MAEASVLNDEGKSLEFFEGNKRAVGISIALSGQLRDKLEYCHFHFFRAMKTFSMSGLPASSRAYLVIEEASFSRHFASRLGSEEKRPPCDENMKFSRRVFSEV